MGLPALNEEDEQTFARILNDFMGRSPALRALIIERAGYVLSRAGNNPEIDTDRFASLASNAFNAIDRMAEELGEPDFKILHQRGGKHQTLIVRAEEDCLLVAVFPTNAGVEEIEFTAVSIVEPIARQIETARARAPEKTVDLADQNPASMEQIFFRKKAD